MWIILDNKKRETTVLDLLSDHPNLVAFDEYGFELEIKDTCNDPGDHNSRVLFWRSLKEAINDDGSHAIAEALWVEE